MHCHMFILFFIINTSIRVRGENHVRIRNQKPNEEIRRLHRSR
jgi:hypothetical protein